MVLTAIYAKINSPIFSLKQPEGFQVATSLPLPQPSALVGSLAYCLALEQGAGLDIIGKVREMVVAARATLETPVATVSPVVLRRFRVLDKGFETKERGELPPYERVISLVKEGRLSEARRILEVELTDALYREYLSSATFKCLWILHERVRPEILYYIQRLGDTESLCTVEEVWDADCKEDTLFEAKTRYPITVNVSRVRYVRYGSFLLLRMCDEKRELKNYIVPCERRLESTAKGIKFVAYTPSHIKVKFATPTKCYNVDGDIVVR